MTRTLSLLITTVAALVLWSGLSALEGPGRLPGPWAVLRAGVEMVRAEHLLDDAGASLSRVAVGFAGAALAGLTLAALTSLAGHRAAGLRALLELLRPVPPIAWVPLAVLWFGLGDRSAWFIVGVGAFFPIATQAVWGLSNCPPAYLELARSLGASPALTLLRVRVPAALPALAAGLRTALGVAWTSVIAAELVGAQSGLGYRIQLHRLTLETDKVIAGMACIGLLGGLMGRLGAWLERVLVQDANA
jgi:ABC-type nitrate/sulfonate/bicarbonate transport system permease component